MLTPTFSPNEPNFLALLQCLVWTGFRERRRVHRRERGRTRRSTSETDQTETAMKSRSRNRQIVSRNSRDHRSQTGLQVELCIDFALSCENWFFAKRTQFIEIESMPVFGLIRDPLAIGSRSLAGLYNAGRVSLSRPTADPAFRGTASSEPRDCGGCAGRMMEQAILSAQ